MNLSGLLEKTKKIPGKIAGLVPALRLKLFPAPKPGPAASRKARRFSGFEKIKTFLAGIKGTKILEFFESRFPRNIPAHKRRPLLFALGGLVLVSLVLIISIPLTRSGGLSAEPLSDTDAALLIPPEELFSPSEPDYLPDFLPEREVRSSWSVEDIRPYWKKPGNTGLWREEIKTAVDKLMEGVP